MKKEKIDTAIDIIVKLRKQIDFEQNCLIHALHSIPEKYKKIFFKEYIRLLEANNG
jgi:flagellin-specific chaperone FliS